MQLLTKLFLGLLTGAMLLQGAAFEKVAKSRAAEVHISSQKPLTTGNNILFLHVAHKDYHDSTIEVKVFMPAMPGMPYMKAVSTATNLGDGKYTANINLSMHGTWQVHIFVTPQIGKKVRVKTSLTI